MIPKDESSSPKSSLHDLAIMFGGLGLIPSLLFAINASNDQEARLGTAGMVTCGLVFAAGLVSASLLAAAKTIADERSDAAD